MRSAMILSALLAALLAISACGGPAGPTPEDLAREGLLRLRAEAAQRGAGDCLAACDRALARFDDDVPLDAVGVPEARRICRASRIR